LTVAADIAYQRRQAEIGLFYGLFSYLWWGFIPLYFKLVAHVPAIVILSHRVVWSFVLLLIVSIAMKQLAQIVAAVRDRRVLMMLVFSTILLATNWGGFIYAVTTNRVMQSSLGYFINPLVSIALGIILLRERLRPMQAVSLALAIVGVAVIALAQGNVPMIALIVAFSFAGYGLVQKLAHVGPLAGLTVETALLLPLAIAYLWHERAIVTGTDRATDGLLMLSGIVTATPLLAFTAAMRRLKLSTMGFLQYLVPTCQFLLAVFAFQEPLDRIRLSGFVLIWAVLIVCGIDSFRAFRRPVDESAIAEL